MKSIVAALAAFAFAAVSAQQTGIVSVTSPVKGTVFTAGEDAVISWNPDTATVDTIDQIQLASGDPNNLDLLDVIANDIDAADGSYTWTVPEDIEPGVTYAIVFGYAPKAAYSPQFTITGPDGSRE
ncbi:Ser-Thr-rich glycosyl-phosphatidyl-inositol-anchored membrane family-domain-containing protein [Dichotomocladium elegans]|nr:Ser-Thr-rich glycosyl-phosphatidyl-inositol-anchored membrane family-domain-containing protein [Dichotomocladium elegans]